MKTFVVLLLLITSLQLCVCDLLVYWLLGKSSVENANDNAPTKLLLLMFEGFRFDYVEKFNLNGFKTLQRYGVRAEYVIPVFPSNSYPNCFSAVTGLYTKYHGILDDYMYDEQKDEIFAKGSESFNQWWNKTEPIWITAEKHGVETAIYWWDGCHIKYGGITAKHCEQHHSVADHPDWELHNVKLHINDILDRFSKKKTRLAMIHIGGIEFVGQRFGPESIEMEQQVRAFDKILSYLQVSILKRKMQNEVVVMTIGDHGMTKTDESSVVKISIDKYININDIVHMVNSGAFAMIQPKRGKINRVYEDLIHASITGLNVYLKNELPAYYMIKDSKLLLPIVLVAQKGYVLRSLYDNSKQIGSSQIYKGGHGYDPYQVEDMKTIFFARGPGLKYDYTSPPLEMVDHYNIMCRILSIPCLPNNGSWNRIKDLFGDESDITLLDWIITVSAVLTIITCGLIIGYKYTRKPKKKQNTD